MEEAYLFKILHYFLYGFGTLLALTSSGLLYSGLTSHTERLQSRLRMRQSINENKENFKQSTENSSTESFLKKAGNPLGLTAMRYNIIVFGVFFLLLFNYLLLPSMQGRELNIWVILSLVAVYVLLLPMFPYSLFRYMIRRMIDYRQAKKNAEIFMLYDFIMIELKTMTNNRINTYNLLRNIKPYFDVIDQSFAKLLVDWSSNKGPQQSLDEFAEALGTKEAQALVGVLKTLDDVDIDTALDSLKGMNDMFVRSQIENYRRRRKVTTDLLSIPIKITHFLIILNFLIVIITMVAMLIGANQGNLPSAPS